jgi:hypothetical protein
LPELPEVDPNDEAARQAAESAQRALEEATGETAEESRRRTEGKPYRKSLGRKTKLDQ